MCVVPALGDGGVTIVSFINGKETSRQQLDATGQQRAVERDGCTGWESSQFSADDRRVYLRSELTCSGSLKRVSSAVLRASRPRSEIRTRATPSVIASPYPLWSSRRP